MCWVLFTRAANSGPRPLRTTRRSTLAKGLELAEQRFPKAGKIGLDEQWYDWIIAQVLMREAKALIEGNSGQTQEAK